MTGGGGLLIESAPGQMRALLYEAGQVVEAWHDFAHDPDLTGSVHRVRIDRVFEGQNRATARLADGTAISIRLSRHDKLASGASALVTIIAARREDKPWQAVPGARLVGRHIVLLPGQDGLATSSRMAVPPASDVMARLTAELDASPGFGAVLRRDADSAGDLPAELSGLIAEWRERSGDLAGEGCVYDGGSFADRLKRHHPTAPVTAVESGLADSFAADWDAMIEGCCGDQLDLAGGGRLWIEATRALTAIDLDSGGGSLASLLAEAPAVIAAQLRLRQTGGLVAVDVPRAAKAASIRFDAALDAALARDPRHPERIGRTRAGLTEVRLPHGRTGPQGWAADSMVTAALSVLRDVALRPAMATARIEVPQVMSDWLRGAGAPALATLDRPVALVVSSQAVTATLIEGPG